MLQAAQAKGLTTAAIGKFGAAFIQDYKRGGIILDEDAAMPLGFAKELQQAGYPLPRNSVNAYEAGALTLAKDNGDPTAPIPIQRLKDGQTGNPLDRSGALSRRGFAYLTDVFVNYILPNKKPDLTIFWSKEPDATNHAYGPGTYNSIDATRMNDEILGRVVEKLRQLGWEKSTDIIITQDHNHSTVSGDVAHYPLRAIVDRGVGAHDPHGYSVSGFVRTAELLTRDGLKAYDGAGCRDIPILSGITADGTHLHPRKDDQHGDVCGRAQKYTSPSYVVPKPIPAGAIVVAANAGSDYLFVPDGNIDTVKAAVASLQSRLQFGAIFVSDKYGEIAGTLPMSLIKTESSGKRPGAGHHRQLQLRRKRGCGGEVRRQLRQLGQPQGRSRQLLADRYAYLTDGERPGLQIRPSTITLPTANVDIAPTVARILAVQHAGCSGTRARGSAAGRTAGHRIRGAEQDAPVLDQDRIDREAADRPGRPGGRSQADQLFRRAEDEDPHPRWRELHLLRSGQSRPRVNFSHHWRDQTGGKRAPAYFPSRRVAFMRCTVSPARWLQMKASRTSFSAWRATGHAGAAVDIEVELGDLLDHVGRVVHGKPGVGRVHLVVVLPGNPHHESSAAPRSACSSC